MTNKNQLYLPKERVGYEPSKNALVSYGPAGGKPTTLPNTVTDPIAVNNISNAEFDYTESLDNE